MGVHWREYAGMSVVVHVLETDSHPLVPELTQVSDVRLTLVRERVDQVQQPMRRCVLASRKAEREARLLDL